MTKSIEIRDAHEHSLRHVDLTIPRDSIVVVTGVSGSGKLDELMVGGCFRDDTWTRLTYLNQKPENYWPVLSKK